MPRFLPAMPFDHEPIEGPHGVRLRPIAPSDIPDLMRWRRDPEVQEFYSDPPETEAECLARYFVPDVNPTWRFIIQDGRQGVGQIQYHHPYADTDYTWSAGIDIYIGEPEARNRGVGTEAVRVLLRYLFEVKGIHRATIDPEPANARAIRAYSKAGYRHEATLRHNTFENGEYKDTYWMTILEDEWPAAKAAWLGGPGDADRR